MGTSESKSYENDPYLNDQNNYNSQIANYYENSSVLPLSNNNKNDKIKEQKHYKTVKLTSNFIINRGSLKLERDAASENMLYISFEYITHNTVELKAYYNALLDMKNNKIKCNFESVPIIINKSTLISNNNNNNFKKFISNDLSINGQDIQTIKNHDNDFFDIIIKVKTIDIENTFEMYIFCNISIIKNSRNLDMKYLKQKMFLDSEWFDVHDVYGLANKDQNDEGLCEICCSDVRNTFFIPCMHSYTCEKCSIELRIKDPRCPICRQSKNYSH